MRGPSFSRNGRSLAELLVRKWTQGIPGTGRMRLLALIALLLSLPAAASAQTAAEAQLRLRIQQLEEQVR